MYGLYILHNVHRSLLAAKKTQKNRGYFEVLWSFFFFFSLRLKSSVLGPSDFR